MNIRTKNLIILLWTLLYFVACTKHDDFIESTERSGDSATHLISIKRILKDSLSDIDFNTVDFSKTYSGKNTASGDYFVRLGFRNKKIADDFILIKTDSAGTLIKAKIVHVQWTARDEAFTQIAIQTSSLNRKLTSLINTKIVHDNSNKRQHAKVHDGNSNLLMQAEAPAGEQTLPEVIVVGYTYFDPVPVYWYYYDGLLGSSASGSGSYTYGAAEPVGGSGSLPTIQVDYEYPDNEEAIDINKYIHCFGAEQEADATYTITIATDIPVDGDPSRFFNWSENSPGHSFIELSKKTNTEIVHQIIGFYPRTGWKSANNYFTPSKVVDNSAHEYNASYTISVNNIQFKAALYALQTYSAYNYNISTFNCTDFALGIFNAAGGNLSIPKYQIPGYPSGTDGSNTPQGLYDKLDQMATAGYTGVNKSAKKNYAGISHGPCD